MIFLITLAFQILAFVLGAYCLLSAVNLLILPIDFSDGLTTIEAFSLFVTFSAFSVLFVRDFSSHLEKQQYWKSVPQRVQPIFQALFSTLLSLFCFLSVRLYAWILF